MPTALIQFTQGSSTPAGQARIGSLGTPVTVNNGDNTDVFSWVIEMADVPAGSSVSTGTLNSGFSGTPSASFTPDAPGCYRVVLTVSDGSSEDVDIRNFAVRNGRGVFAPPYQKLPDPLPLEDKPDELNFLGQTRGWAGGLLGGMTEQFFETYDDFTSTSLSSSPVTIGAQSVTPLYVVDLDTIGGDGELTLPPDCRNGQVIRIQAKGTTAGRVLTVQSSTGSIDPYGTVDVLVGTTAILYHEGLDVWRSLSAQVHTYERILSSGDASTEETDFVVVGAAHINTGDFPNLQSVVFRAILETTSNSDPAEVRLFNVTTGTVVASSTLQTTSEVPALVSSAVTLAEGPNIYEAQLRLSGSGSPDRATCKNAQLLISWVQV